MYALTHFFIFVSCSLLLYLCQPPPFSPQQIPTQPTRASVQKVGQWWGQQETLFARCNWLSQSMVAFWITSFVEKRRFSGVVRVMRPWKRGRHDLLLPAHNNIPWINPQDSPRELGRMKTELKNKWKRQQFLFSFLLVLALSLSFFAFGLVWWLLLLLLLLFLCKCRRINAFMLK